MFTSIKTFAISLLLLVLLSACAPTPATTEEPEAPIAETDDAATATAAPTETPVPPTEPPTSTTAPPSETPTPAPAIVFQEEDLAADGCPLVELNTASWSPMYAGFNNTDDPFFQFHSNEEGFYFNVELYTVYGAGWTGQLGTFAPDCIANGICIYLALGNDRRFLATDGEVAINALSQENGTLSGAVDLVMTNLTMMPVPGSAATGCHHIDEVAIKIDQ